MKHVTRHRIQRGFTLMHMLVALPLLSIFIFIGSKLFITNNQLFQETDNAEQRLIHTEQALKKLRTDAWLSTGLQLKGNTLIVEHPNGHIQWDIDEHGRLTRVGADGTTKHTFTDIGTTAIKIRHNEVVLLLGQEAYLCPTSPSMVTTTRAGQP